MIPSFVETLVPVFRCRIVPLGSMDQVIHTEFSLSTSSSSILGFYILLELPSHIIPGGGGMAVEIPRLERGDNTVDTTTFHAIHRVLSFKRDLKPGSSFTKCCSGLS